LTFGLAAAAVYLAFNQTYIVNWGVVALAVLAGAFFATCLGLLLGLLFENQGTLNLWMGLVLALLLAPMLLDLWSAAPDNLVAVAYWMPTAGLLRLFWQALTTTPARADLAGNLLPLLIGTGLLLALIQIRLRRLDR
jgi:ABC-type Na+ efflux pump permease subunit